MTPASNGSQVPVSSSDSSTSHSISFPAHELPAYRQRLSSGQHIFTTRVSAEVGLYLPEHFYHSPLGDLQVVSRQHFDQLQDHPFLTELTPAQKQEISTYLDKRGMDIVELKVIKNR